MNVFEYLSIPERRNPVQLVKHYDEVPDSKKKFPMLGQIKYDGVFGMIVVNNGDIEVFGRTGKKLTNCELLIEFAWLHHLPDGVWIGEVLTKYQPFSLEQLSGVVNPNRTKPLDGTGLKAAGSLYMMLHDVISISDFKAGYSEKTYSQRYATLSEHIPSSCRAKSCEIIDEIDLEAFAAGHIANKHEGAVFKQQDAHWVAGHKGCHSMKKVRGVRYDLECVGVEEGKGKMKGKAGNLLFRYRDGQVIKCPLGKGYSHADAENVWLGYCKAQVSGFSNANPVGQIYTVYALQESSANGKLRLPKVGEKRHDKLSADF